MVFPYKFGQNPLIGSGDSVQTKLILQSLQNCSMFPLAFVAGDCRVTDEALLAETT